MFMGEFHHTIDEKGRIIIPAKVRALLGSHFIVTRGLDNCLFIYPQDKWQNIVKKYEELPNTQDARNFMRFFLSGATECDYDKLGRINISSPLVNYAGLSKDCIIIGVNDRLELWSADKWNNFITSNESNLSEIADKLFG